MNSVAFNKNNQLDEDLVFTILKQHVECVISNSSIFWDNAAISIYDPLATPDEVVKFLNWIFDGLARPFQPLDCFGQIKSSHRDAFNTRTGRNPRFPRDNNRWYKSYCQFIGKSQSSYYEYAGVVVDKIVQTLANPELRKFLIQQYLSRQERFMDFLAVEVTLTQKGLFRSMKAAVSGLNPELNGLRLSSHTRSSSNTVGVNSVDHSVEAQRIPGGVQLVARHSSNTVTVSFTRQSGIRDYKLPPVYSILIPGMAADCEIKLNVSDFLDAESKFFAVGIVTEDKPIDPESLTPQIGVDTLTIDSNGCYSWTPMSDLRHDHVFGILLFPNAMAEKDIFSENSDLLSRIYARLANSRLALVPQADFRQHRLSEIA